MSWISSQIDKSKKAEIKEKKIIIFITALESTYDKPMIDLASYSRDVIRPRWK